MHVRWKRLLQPQVLTAWLVALPAVQLFYSFFKTLVGKEIVVERRMVAEPAQTALAETARSARPAYLRISSPPPSQPRLPLAALVPDLAIRGTLHSVDQYLNIKLLGGGGRGQLSAHAVRKELLYPWLVINVQLPASRSTQSSFRSDPGGAQQKKSG